MHLCLSHESSCRRPTCVLYGSTKYERKIVQQLPFANFLADACCILLHDIDCISISLFGILVSTVIIEIGENVCANCRAKWYVPPTEYSIKRNANCVYARQPLTFYFTCSRTE